MLTNNWYPLAGAEAGAVQEMETVEEPTLPATTAGAVGAVHGGGFATRMLSRYRLLPYSEIPLKEIRLVLAGRLTVFRPHCAEVGTKLEVVVPAVFRGPVGPPFMISRLE